MTTKENDSTEELEVQYNEITVLYDFAEELVNTVESTLVQNPDAQLKLVEPLINDLGDAADVLAEEFILIAESKKRKAQNRASKTHIEAALRKIYAAINEYQSSVKDVSKKAHGAIMNIADPIIQKIQRQVEKIVVIFMEFVQISLQNVMGKAELEALKLRDTRIAMFMHQQAMSQQQG